MPKVSLIIPIYNAEPLLEQCLQSVVSQTLSDLEIICVNDGSTDGSGRVLGQFAARDERIRIVDQENRGCSAARNSGYAAATGEYVLFLDADDYFEPTMVEEVYSRCIEHDADVCVFRIRCLYPDTGMVVDADWSLQMALVPEHVPFAGTEMGGHLFRFVTPVVWTKMIRRTFLEATGLRFSTEFRRAEDVPFTYMVLALATRITVLDRALVNYRMHNEHSLHATIHTAPLDIVRALLKVKQEAIAANVYAQIERDFVNAALEQSLYNLDVLGTAESARELFTTLKEDAFAQFGIAEHEREYFFDQRRYEQYCRVVDQPWADYLFGYARLLRADLTRSGRWARDLSRWLDECRADLESATASNSQLQEDLSGVSQSSAQLQAEIDEVRARLLTRVWELRDQVGSTQESLYRANGALRDAKRKLKRIRESRSYRFARAMTAIPRRMKRMIKSAGRTD